MAVVGEKKRPVFLLFVIPKACLRSCRTWRLSVPTPSANLATTCFGLVHIRYTVEGVCDPSHSVQRNYKMAGICSAGGRNNEYKYGDKAT